MWLTQNQFRTIPHDPMHSGRRLSRFEAVGDLATPSLHDVVIKDRLRLVGLRQREVQRAAMPFPEQVGGGKNSFGRLPCRSRGIQLGSQGREGDRKSPRLTSIPLGTPYP